jgi:hypothetical protein
MKISRPTFGNENWGYIFHGKAFKRDYNIYLFLFFCYNNSHRAKGADDDKAV